MGREERGGETQEDFLRGQLDAIVDALFSICYQPHQLLWNQATCPWCIRMLQRGIIDDCPVCSQIQRSRTSGRAEVKRGYRSPHDRRSPH